MESTELIGQTPTEVVPQLTVEEETETYARIVAEPLEPGYGITLGNALRRVLLSSLEGAAITSVRIDQVMHEFSSIPGMHEDTTEFLLNVKEIFRGSSGRLGGSAILKSGTYTERDSPSASPVPQGGDTGTMEFTLSPSGGNWVMYEMEIKE